MSAATTNRVAVVTGAGQGLGRAIAKAFDAAGITVAAVGRTKSKLDDTIAQLGGNGLAVSADLGDPEAVRRVFREVEAKLGHVDILVNNHAEYAPFPFDTASDHQIDNMVMQSLTSSLYTMREAIAYLRMRGGGDIVNISSQSAVQPQPYMSIYGGLKAALEVICTGLRWEFKGEDLRFMICQVGSVQGTDPSGKSGFGEHLAAAIALWDKTGMDKMYSQPGSPPGEIAAAITHAVTAPRDMYIPVIQIRGSDADVHG